jgi:matrix metalloproteinase-20 (enamelysin)
MYGRFLHRDIAAHEFGHALGLGHSTINSATMYPSVSSCNAGNRTLDSDDIAGVRFLYPPTSAAPSQVQNLRVIRGS